jgi:S1-C subfamily serine protease
VRRLGVIVCICVGFAALAPASLSDDRLAFAVVGIDARIGNDTVHSAGAVIDADNGLILTSAHTVWGATSLRLSTGVGVLHGRIVARAPCADLALLETQPRIPAWSS